MKTNYFLALAAGLGLWVTAHAQSKDSALIAGPVTASSSLTIAAFNAGDPVKVEAQLFDLDGNLLGTGGVRELKRLTGTKWKFPTPCEILNDLCNIVALVSVSDSVGATVTASLLRETLTGLPPLPPSLGFNDADAGMTVGHAGFGDNDTSSPLFIGVEDLISLTATFLEPPGDIRWTVRDLAGDVLVASVGKGEYGFRVVVDPAIEMGFPATVAVITEAIAKPGQKSRDKTVEGWVTIETLDRDSYEPLTYQNSRVKLTVQEADITVDPL